MGAGQGVFPIVQRHRALHFQACCTEHKNVHNMMYDFMYQMQ